MSDIPTHIKLPYWLQLFFSSLQFISRIPVPQRFTQNLVVNDYVKGVVFFPLVGFIIGMFCAVTFSITQYFWGALIASLFAVLINAVITGAFHLDGLADTADGIFTVYDRQKMLEIMRDSRIGTNGVLALFFVTSLKIALLYYLASQSVSVIPLLITAPVIARTLVVVILMHRQHYARSNGLGNIYIGKVTGSQAALTLICGTFMIMVVNGGPGLICALLTFGFIWGYRTYIHTKLGGQTGDTLGAGIELAELCFCLLMAGYLG